MKFTTNQKTIILIVITVVILFSILLFQQRRTSLRMDEELNEFVRYKYNLETSEDLHNTSVLDTTISESGNKSTFYNDTLEFGVTIYKPVASLPDYKKIRKAEFNFVVNNEMEINKAIAVFSVESPDGVMWHWEGVDIKLKPGKWQKYESAFPLVPENIREDGIVKVYIWNKGFEKFHIDDLELVLYGEKDK